MAIVKMKRLRLLALQQEQEALFSRLQHLGCVEITESEGRLSSPEWAALLRRDTSSSAGDVKAEITQISHALDALQTYAPVKSGLFEKRRCLSEQEFLDSDAFHSSLALSNAINESLTKIARFHAQENRLAGIRAGLLPWASMGLPLANLSTEHVKVVLGVCPAAAELSALSKQLAEEAPLTTLISVHEDRDQHYLLLLYHKAEAEAAETVLKTYSFSPVLFKNTEGTAADNIAKIDAELQEIAAARLKEEQTIASYRDSRPALKFCLDRLQQSLSQELAREHLLTNGTIVFLEGWVSVHGLDSLEQELSKFSCAYALSDPEPEDKVPTLLKNPKWLSPINMVTEMYSLPAYRGIDPNPLIFGFYIIFFGFMFADIGYGIILTVLSALITIKYRPKYTVGYMFHLGIYLGLSAFVFGILTGGFFGDALPVFAATFLGKEITIPYLINPLEDPMMVLIVAIAMGIVQLLFGQCVHMYMEFRDGRPLDGILDVVPWWVLFAGIVLFALGRGATGILVGLVVLVLTQGRHKKGLFGKLFGGIASLYDITSWLSDVLSYSRLMALMLATSVIASVMNILGALPQNILAFFIVFVIGHVFNIGVNIIGTYVHAARLQYLEFFSKFYKEGGIPFRPLAYQTKYIDITTEEET